MIILIRIGHIDVSYFYTLLMYYLPKTKSLDYIGMDKGRFIKSSVPKYASV